MTSAKTAAPDPISVRLAEYITRPVHNFPAYVLDRARLGILDTVGCMVGAGSTRAGGLIRCAVSARAGSGETTMIGVPGGFRAEDSLLVNSTLGHMLEFDDGHRPSDNHLGCVVVPTALTMAQETGATLAECLDAIVVGYDVMGRVGEATLLPRRRSPFHGTGTTGVFGAAAVAARLLGLDAMQTAHALAIAGTAAAGLRESTNTGPDCKPLHAGRAASSGISSAFLAAAGYLGPLTIFEGQHGFCMAMCEQPRPELICDGLGERFAVVESGFKVHSTCGMLFNVLDGVLEAREKYELQNSLPSVVRVGVPSWLTIEPAFSRRRPKTGGEARFSIPFAVAAAIVDGVVSPYQMSDSRLQRTDLEGVEELVEIVTDDEIEEVFQATRNDPFFFYPASVEFERGGEAYRSVHLNPRGYDTNLPLTQPEVIRKFRSTVVGALDDDDATVIAAMALSSDDAGAIGHLMTQLAGAVRY